MNSLKLLTILGIVAVAAGCAGAADSPAVASGSPAATSGDPEIAARVNDAPITMAEVDEKAKSVDSKPYQALYDARRQALELIVADRLLVLEAEERGLTKEILLNQEVDEGFQPPTPEQVEAFYNQNKASMRNQTLEQVGPQIQNHLANQSRQQAMTTLLTGLRSKHNVKVNLDPPRVEVTIAENDPSKGPAGAPIQILEFSDFQ